MASTMRKSRSAAEPLVVVVEASTNLANAIWLPLSTNTLTGGSAYFRIRMILQHVEPTRSLICE